jgi:hypothetical protein
MGSDIENVKNKIKKLLNLSKSDNENEAMAALEKAQSLIEEYGLNKPACIYESVKVKATTRLVPWRNVIGNAVAWLYNCYKYIAIDGAYVFTGDSVNAFLAGEMYAYLIKCVERAAKQNIRKNAKAKFRASYKYGMADRLFERIHYLGEACSWAPRRDAEIKAVTAFVKASVSVEEARPKKETKLNEEAASRGRGAAEGISLNRQTGSSPVAALYGGSCA